jgi:hypothetical protein
VKGTHSARLLESDLEEWEATGKENDLSAAIDFESIVNPAEPVLPRDGQEFMRLFSSFIGLESGRRLTGLESMRRWKAGLCTLVPVDEALMSGMVVCATDTKFSDEVCELHIKGTGYRAGPASDTIPEEAVAAQASSAFLEEEPGKVLRVPGTEKSIDRTGFGAFVVAPGAVIEMKLLYDIFRFHLSLPSCPSANCRLKVAGCAWWIGYECWIEPEQSQDILW